VTAAGAAADSVYRPLSLLALAGFGLAAVFMAVMVVLAAFALFSRTPLLLAVYWFLIPLATLGLCWVARQRVRDSEGTLSGEALASWGLTLSLLVILLYGSYYAATFFALRQQATAYADRWLDELKKGHVERAYWMALLPESRSGDIDSPGLRESLEARFNGATTSGYTLGNFRCAELTTLLGQAGEKARLQLVGVNSWQYDHGTYRVDLRYRLEAPDAIGDVKLELIGTEPTGTARQGRQWRVRSEKFQPIANTARLTPLGEQHKPLADAARDVFDEWRQKLNDPDSDDAYLLTLPPDQRHVPADNRLYAFPAFDGCAGLGAAGDQTRRYVAGRLLYQAGGLIHLDPKTFWAAKSQYDDVLRALQYGFVTGPKHRAVQFFLSRGVVPPYVEENAGRVRVVFAGQAILTHGGGPEYSVDCRVAVEGNSTAASGATSGWRVVALEPVTGYTAPASGDPRLRAMMGPGGP
jgi:hypothetical protein